jgi:hypothetical protein
MRIATVDLISNTCFPLLADAHSDVDLGVIIADAAYDDFLTSREPVRRAGVRRDVLRGRTHSFSS